MSNLNYLMTVIQYFKFIIKLFLKFLISLIILTEINDMKKLIKTMKIMIFIMIAAIF